MNELNFFHETTNSFANVSSFCFDLPDITIVATVILCKGPKTVQKWNFKKSSKHWRTRMKSRKSYGSTKLHDIRLMLQQQCLNFENRTGRRLGNEWTRIQLMKELYWIL